MFNFRYGEGWSEKVLEALSPFAEKWGEYALLSGPAHIFYGDDNYEDDNIRWCIDACDSQELIDNSGKSWRDEWIARGFVLGQLEDLKNALVQVLEIPEDERRDKGHGYCDCPDCRGNHW